MSDNPATPWYWRFATAGALVLGISSVQWFAYHAWAGTYSFLWVDCQVRFEMAPLMDAGRSQCYETAASMADVAYWLGGLSVGIIWLCLLVVCAARCVRGFNSSEHWYEANGPGNLELYATLLAIATLVAIGCYATYWCGYALTHPAMFK